MTLELVDAGPMTEEQVKAKVAGYIVNPPRNSRVFNVSPAAAEWILETYNKGNRAKKPTHIKRYAEAMAKGAAGRPLTGDTIKFSDAHVLRDGQNRLFACVQAGVPFGTHVVFGIEDSVFDKLDQGKNRDSGDVLAIEGYQNPTHLAGAIRWAERFENGGLDREGLEPSATREFARKKYVPGNMEERVQEARRIYQTTRHPIGLVAAVLFRARQKDPRAAAKFAQRWETRGEGGKNAVDGKQIAAMIKALDKLGAASVGRIHDTVRAAWAVQAWNAFVGKRRLTVNSFIWKPGDDFPEFD